MIRTSMSRPAKPKTDDAPAKRANHRVLLPSLRVAEFRLPNVGEFLSLREEALRAAAKDAGGAPSDIEIGFALGRASLRSLLVGLSRRPVQPLYRVGFSPEESRTRLRADGAAAGLSEAAIEGAIERAEVDGEDADKMKESASLEPVTDLVWETTPSIINQLMTAAMGTAEAADWQALTDFATMHLPAVMRSIDGGPKARIRPMR